MPQLPDPPPSESRIERWRRVWQARAERLAWERRMEDEFGEDRVSTLRRWYEMYHPKDDPPGKEE